MTDGPPLHACARRLNEAKLASAKKEFAKMEAEGIIPPGRPCSTACRNRMDRFARAVTIDDLTPLLGMTATRFLLSQISLRT